MADQELEGWRFFPDFCDRQRRWKDDDVAFHPPHETMHIIVGAEAEFDIPPQTNGTHEAGMSRQILESRRAEARDARWGRRAAKGINIGEEGTYGDS